MSLGTVDGSLWSSLTSSDVSLAVAQSTLAETTENCFGVYMQRAHPHGIKEINTIEIRYERLRLRPALRPIDRRGPQARTALWDTDGQAVAAVCTLQRLTIWYRSYAITGTW